MLELATYCPILHARQSEIRALLQLSAAAKDKLFAVIVARPWPNASKLEMTWSKIEEALGDRRYALDLDAFKYGAGGRQPASSDFDLLFDRTGGYRNFYNLLAELPRAVPVIQDGELATQLDHIRVLERGAVVRLQADRGAFSLGMIESILQALDDVVFVIDAGWSVNLLNLEAWASSWVSNISARRPEAEIVIAGSSFPEDFAHVGARALEPIRERTLFQNLLRRHNVPLIYGDWASTRRSREATPMRSVPRIDLPKAGEWVLYRRVSEDDEDEDYRDIAQRVIADPAFQDEPNVWGTYSISCTAENLPGAIRSAAVAASARINIHLHKQAFFGHAGEVSDDLEPFTDD